MGRPRLYVNEAAKLQAYRQRHELVAVTVQLPVELVDGLNEYLRFKDMTKNEVFAKLLRSQLLRKR